MQAQQAPPTGSTLPIPEGVSEAAAGAFARMIRDLGADVHRLPATCHLHLAAYLRGHPAELALLDAALRLDVPARILAAACEPGFPEFLDRATGELASAGFELSHAEWAVRAWACALGRPPGYEPLPVTHPDPPPRPSAEAERRVRYLMRCIVCAGGATGALLGWSLRLWVFVAFVVVEERFGVNQGAARFLFAQRWWFVFGIIGAAVCGALGALAGWHTGRGDERPWACAAVAFGAAFGVSAYATFRVGPNAFAAVIILLATHSATFTAAARGGRRAPI